MKISPISCNKSYSKSFNSDANANNINFKSYKSAFLKCEQAQLRTRVDLRGFITNLINELKVEAQLDPKFLKIYNNHLITGALAMEDFLNDIKKNFKESASVARNKNDSKLVYTFDDSLVFSHPENKDEFITISKNSKNGIEIDRDTEYSTDIYKFYPYGGIKSVTKVSGQGLAQISDTTHYDQLGRKRTFRNFLDYFGI